MLTPLSFLFQTPPPHWGLRGDPSLWTELQEISASLRMPESVNELEELLPVLFKELTGELPERGRNILVERFNTGGMSSGLVSGDFWLDIGFPLLVKRYLDWEEIEIETEQE